MIVKAISIKQPWASMIADGRKRLEIRSWEIAPIKNVLVCSTKNPNIYLAGYALCLVDFIKCRKFLPKDEEKACISFLPELFPNNLHAWEIENVRTFPPFRVSGQQKIFKVRIPENIIDIIAPLLD